MKHQHPSDPIDVLGSIYEKMFEQVVENFHDAKEASVPVLHKCIEMAQEEAVKLEEVTKEEGNKLADWLKQDIHEVGHFLAKNGQEMKDWLGFDARFLESAALDKLIKAADKTEIQLLALKIELARRLISRTGEVIGAGTLVCTECGEKLHFHKAGKIPPCPKCHGTSFRRGH